MRVVLDFFIIAVYFFSSFITFASGIEDSDPFSQKKFVPAISFIMDFSYLNGSINGTDREILHIPGFTHSGHSHGHSHSIGGDGFSLNYAELGIFATVDPYFDLFTAFHMGEDHFGIEEVYVTTRKLPHGFGTKIGKFLSSFGRMNSQHAHIWNFREIPLVYRVFFGEEGLNEKGIQINWVAPTDFYLSFGCEILQGENNVSFGIQEEHHHNGTNEEEESGSVKIPGLITVFGKTSTDIGELVILGGISYAEGETRLNHKSEDSEQILSGRSKIFGVDITLKYLLDSYKYISLQTEFMNRKFNGLLHHENMEKYNNHDNSFSKSQSGFYSEFVYRFARLWRTALRFDMLSRNRVFSDGKNLGFPEDMKRYSFMIDYSPTEFSRIRLQYNYNKHLYSKDNVKNFGELNLQLNIAVGAHGAHQF